MPPKKRKSRSPVKRKKAVKRKAVKRVKKTVTKKTKRAPRPARKKAKTTLPTLPMPWELPCGGMSPPTVEQLQLVAATYDMDVRGVNWSLPIAQICQQLETRWPRGCIPTGYSPSRVLAVGSAGMVFLSCRKGACDRVLKLQLPGMGANNEDDDGVRLYPKQDKIYPTSEKEFKEEVQFQKAAGSLAPKLFHHTVCTVPNGRILFLMEMEKMDGTWWELFPKGEELVEGDRFNARGLAFVEPVFRLLNQLHKKGIIHGDAHSSNIFYKLNLKTGVTTPLLGDFGGSYPVPADAPNQAQADDITFFLEVESYRFPDALYENLNRTQLKEVLRRTGTPSAVAAIVLAKWTG